MKKSEIQRLKKVAKSKTIPAIALRGLVKDGRIYATNLEVTISFPCEIKGQGIVELSEIEQPFENAWIQGNKLFIERNGAITQSRVFDANDFPQSPEREVTPSATINAKQAQKLRLIKQFCGNDETRPAMCGVYLDAESKMIVATDAHRLVWERFDCDIQTSVIIPTIGIELLTEIDYIVYLSYEKNKLATRITFLAKDGSEEIETRLIDGNFPNYKAVIPENSSFTLQVPTDVLIQNIESAKKTQKLRTFFLIENDALQLLSFDTDNHKQFYVKIPCQSNITEGFDVGMNPDFLLSLLRYHNQPTTTFKFIAPHKPIIVNDNHLIMPVMIEGDVKLDDYLPKPIQTDSETVEIPETSTSEPETEPEPETHNPEPETQNSETETPGHIVIVDYNEKSILVIGDTKRFKQQFKEFHGAWNPFVTIENIRIGGWFFSKKRRPEIEKLIAS